MRILFCAAAAEAPQALASASALGCTALSVLPGPASASKGNSRPLPCSLLAARMLPYSAARCSECDMPIRWCGNVSVLVLGGQA